MSVIEPSTIGQNTDTSKVHSVLQKIATALGFLGLFIMVLALANVTFPQKTLWLTVALGSIIIGIILYARDSYMHKPAGIQWDGTWFKNISNRGLWAWGLGIVLTAFYVVLYWFPQYLGFNDGQPNTGLVSFFDPLSYLISGKPASQWFLYGSLYTIAILSFGYKFILKYRHNKYQVIRTCSIMFFQLGFAFLLPEILSNLNPDKPYFGDAKNMWPLNYYFFDKWHVEEMTNSGNFGMWMLIIGLSMVFIISPILTYFYGKRWYCSWVCGCGGLAETAGDPFRHLSDKSEKAWKFERICIHAVLVFIFVTTVSVIYGYLHDEPDKFWLTKDVFIYGIVALLAFLTTTIYIFKKKSMDKDAIYTMVALCIIMIAVFFTNYTTGNGKIFFIDAEALKQWYGFAIGAMFSGVIGVGFYPIMGSRVWCRFGCPMAAVLGLQQRIFSRFRITTNGGQCISCGNCSNACEMGIDVRAYAQKGENIVRSSCVGCGICSAVCPRGVLKLENGKEEGRITNNAVLLGNDADIFGLLRAQEVKTDKL